MSERGKDKRKQLTKRAVPRRVSSRIHQVGPINYMELDLSLSETESESTIVGSESGFGSKNVELEDKQAEAQWIYYKTL